MELEYFLKMIKKCLEKIDDPTIHSGYKQYIINTLINEPYNSLAFLKIGNFNYFTKAQYNRAVCTAMKSELAIEFLQLKDFIFKPRHICAAIDAIIKYNKEDTALLCKNFNLTKKQKNKLLKSIILKHHDLKIKGLIKYDFIFDLYQIKILVQEINKDNLPVEIGILLYNKYEAGIEQLDLELVGQLDAKIVTYKLSKN